MADSIRNNQMEQFQRAVIDGNTERIARLIEDGLETEHTFKETGLTLLLQITEVGTPSMVRLLADRGANLIARDRNGNGFISRAARHGRVDLVLAILELGADPNEVNHFGMTPLHQAVASENRSPQLLQVLLAAGADADKVTTHRFTPRQKAARYGVTLPES